MANRLVVDPRDRFLHNFIEYYPPLFWVFGYGVFVFDERWRLPYRWYEFKRHWPESVSMMLFGAAVMVWKPRIRKGANG